MFQVPKAGELSQRGIGKGVFSGLRWAFHPSRPRKLNHARHADVGSTALGSTATAREPCEIVTVQADVEEET